MAVYWLSFTPNPTDSAGLNATFLNFIKFDGTTLTPPGITQLNAGTGIYQFTYTPSFSIAFRIDGATSSLAASQRYVVGNLDITDNLNTDLTALGSTLIAIGNTTATSLTNVGTTLVAIGNTTATSFLNLGSTVIAIGNTTGSLGATISSIATNVDTVLGYGLTTIAGQSFMGITLVSIGNSMLAGLSGIGLSLTVTVAGLGSTASIYGGASLEPVDIYGYLKWTKEFLSGSQSFNKTTGTWNIFDRNFSTLLISKSVNNNVSGVTRF